METHKSMSKGKPHRFVFLSCCAVSIFFNIIALLVLLTYVFTPYLDPAAAYISSSRFCLEVVRVGGADRRESQVCQDFSQTMWGRLGEPNPRIVNMLLTQMIGITNPIRLPIDRILEKR